MKKSRTKPSKTKAAPAVTLTETLERCRHITTLAELLEQCGRVRPAEPIAPQLIGNAGDMIAVESRAVREFLEHLVLQMRRPV